jgi:hypothetical protein
MIKNIYKGWKSTILGIALFICGLGYVFYNATPDYVIMSILLASGVILIFAPDFLIERLQDLISKKSKEV